MCCGVPAVLSSVTRRDESRLGSLILSKLDLLWYRVGLFSSCTLTLLYGSRFEEDCSWESLWKWSWQLRSLTMLSYLLSCNPNCIPVTWLYFDLCMLFSQCKYLSSFIIIIVRVWLLVPLVIAYELYILRTRERAASLAAGMFPVSPSRDHRAEINPHTSCPLKSACDWCLQHLVSKPTPLPQYNCINGFDFDCEWTPLF